MSPRRLFRGVAVAEAITWAGLLVGWVLFFTFLTGTLGYFDDEIDRWMSAHALGPLKGPGSPRQRLARMIAALDGCWRIS